MQRRISAFLTISLQQVAAMQMCGACRRATTRAGTASVCKAVRCGARGFARPLTTGAEAVAGQDGSRRGQGPEGAGQARAPGDNSIKPQKGGCPIPWGPCSPVTQIFLLLFLWLLVLLAFAATCICRPGATCDCSALANGVAAALRARTPTSIRCCARESARPAPGGLRRPGC